MYLHRKLENKGNFFRKIKDLDFILLACILLLGFISLATMYSTDSGEVLFHTRSHFTKFIIFLYNIAVKYTRIRHPSIHHGRVLRRFRPGCARKDSRRRRFFLDRGRKSSSYRDDDRPDNPED